MSSLKITWIDAILLRLCFLSRTTRRLSKSMNILVTGEAGFIATNLIQSFEKQGDNVVSIEDSNVSRLRKTGEVCVHRNTEEVWAWHLKNLNVDVVVHNAAVVGTDVVALNSAEATLSNVAGTYNIVRACNAANVGVCYMGTTVIYDTAKYQDTAITEDSLLNPTTFYGIQKLAAERLVMTHSNRWMVIRPLFAYGGVGDMNSLIAKSVFAFKENRKNIDMFLDPDKVKDYLHVEDYCDAVALGCDRGLWGEDFNVAAETPMPVKEIVDVISEEIDYDVSALMKWHPETDYLGNHRLSSSKFSKISGWNPNINLRAGVKRSVSDIMSDSSSYNPLSHLDEAKERKVELTEFFNSNI